MLPATRVFFPAALKTIPARVVVVVFPSVPDMQIHLTGLYSHASSTSLMTGMPFFPADRSSGRVSGTDGGMCGD